MRFALILAGGSGVRLWPVSRKSTPKQLLPVIDGKSLLRLAWERLDGLTPCSHRLVCASEQHRRRILEALPDLSGDRFLGEPVGRDTLNAVGFGAAIIAREDPEAVIAVLTADHIIRPVETFRRVLARGFEVVERSPQTLVTFGIAPDHPATGYGYLELGSELEPEVWVVNQFREKPDAATARRFFEAGPQRYLWNSGMFVWRARTLLDCIRRYAPESFQGLSEIAAAWETSERDKLLGEIYPTLPKISVDFAVMEPASRDPAVRVAAVAMPLEWLDIGSWPAFAKTCRKDEKGNALAAARHVLEDTCGVLVVSTDPQHLISTIGCRDLIIVHTPDATLICRADQAEAVKKLQQEVARLYGDEYL